MRQDEEGGGTIGLPEGWVLVVGYLYYIHTGTSKGSNQLLAL